MKYLSIVIFFCFVGCSRQNTSVHYDSFEEYDSLIAISQEIPPIMLYPRNIFLCNKNTIVYNEKMDTIFQVFDQDYFSYKYSFGVKGQGPDDFILPSTQKVGTTQKGFAILDVKTIKEIFFEEDVPVIQTSIYRVKRTVIVSQSLAVQCLSSLFQK